MPTLIKSREVVDAVMTYLDAGSTTNYLSQGPRDPRSVGKYCVVHPSPGRYSGTVGDHTQDCEVQFQTTSVGITVEQAMWVHDTVSQRLWRATVTPAVGQTTLPIWAVPGSQQPVLRDDDIEPPMFYVTCRWVCQAIPT